MRKEVQKKNSILHAFLLLLAAMIWGFAFVAQSVGMDYLGPFSFNGTRSVMGGIVLLPIALFALKKDQFAKDSKIRTSKTEKKKFIKMQIISCIICGAVLFLATTSQQMGLQYTSAGKAGFLTACYIVMVPLIGLFFKKKSTFLLWISVVLALIGLFCLCITDKIVIEKGDALELLCALLFSFHIISVDYFVDKVNAIALSCGQFLVSGLLGTTCMFVFEKPTLSAFYGALIPLLYAGILSCAGAYTLQIIGQKRVQSTVASLLMSMESVFAVIGAAVILHQSLSMRELIGCVVMFVAIILAQLPVNTKESKEKEAI